MNRTTDKPEKMLKNAKKDRFFDDPIVLQRMAKSTQAYSEGKMVKMFPEQWKDLLGIGGLG